MSGFLVSVVDASHHAGDDGDGTAEVMLWGEYVESEKRRDEEENLFVASLDVVARLVGWLVHVVQLEE